MRLISFNVNGVRACAGKTLIEDLRTLNADVVCLQETKATEEQVAQALNNLDGYQVHAYEASSKKGYSGTATLSRATPLSVHRGIGIDKHDQEGRVITTEFNHFYLVNVYVPNASSGLKRLPYRTQEWDIDFTSYLKQLDAQKPVIVCGDMNVCHQRIDIARPDSNYNKSPGYTQAEIDGFNHILDAGFVDSFRVLHPEDQKFSWWSYRGGARARNVGWRLDYFLVSERMMPHVSVAGIHKEILGSDHCPISLTLNLDL
jgi:exodeoxyribonuclease-3